MQACRASAAIRLVSSPRDRLLFSYDDGFGDAVVNRLTVAVLEVLQETEADFERRGGISQGALNAVPKRKTLVNQRDDAYAADALAKRAPATKPCRNAKVKQRDHGHCHTAEF